MIKNLQNVNCLYSYTPTLLYSWKDSRYYSSSIGLSVKMFFFSFVLILLLCLLLLFCSSGLLLSRPLALFFSIFAHPVSLLLLPCWSLALTRSFISISRSWYFGLFSCSHTLLVSFSHSWHFALFVSCSHKYLVSCFVSLQLSHSLGLLLTILGILLAWSLAFTSSWYLALSVSYSHTLLVSFSHFLAFYSLGLLLTLGFFINLINSDSSARGEEAKEMPKLELRPEDRPK